MDEMLRLEFNLPKKKKTPKKRAGEGARYKYYMADLAVGESRVFTFDEKKGTSMDAAFKKWRSVYRSSLAQQKKYKMTFDLSWSSGGVRVTRMK